MKESSNPFEAQKRDEKIDVIVKPPVAEKTVRPDQTPDPMTFESLGYKRALHYRPEYLSKGGEHLVYDMPDHPDVVVKLNVKSVGDALDLAERLHIKVDSDDPTFVDELEKRLGHRRKMQEALRRSFGREHVVPQKYFLVDAPMPLEIKDSLESMRDFEQWKLPEKIPPTAKAVVAVQPRLKELAGPHLSPTVRSLEGSKLMPKILYDRDRKKSYLHLMEGLMSAEDAEAMNINREEFTSLIGSYDLTKLLQEAESDTELKAVLLDFVEHAVDFAERTDEILDLAHDNVIFFHDASGHWTYLIVDGIYGLQKETLKLGKSAFFKAAWPFDPRKLTDAEGNAIVKAISFTRAINGIGKLVGANKFYTLVPHGENAALDAMKNFFPQLERAG